MVQVLSKEIIKPSSPTPHHHRKMKLSYLDHMNPHVYVPIIFFYEANESSGLTCSNHFRVSQNLKQSLSSALTKFHPLAGTLEGQSHINCNDIGVEVTEARVTAQIANAIQEHNMDDLHQYLPSDSIHDKQTPLFVQITFFECGGMSIGIWFLHLISDCESIMAFVNAWAAACRGKIDVLQPDFTLGNYFPARELPDYSAPVSSSDENVVMKRFIFDEETVMALKQKAISPLVMNPTKVEAITAFIWKHVIEMAKPNSLEATKIIASHAVNLRTRMNSPHSLGNVFGNCLMMALASYDTNCAVTSNQYHDLASNLRSSIKKIDEAYIVEAQHGDKYVNDVNEILSMQRKGELMEWYFFSSWCRFPVYEVNYGWGNPVRVCTYLPIPNVVTLMGTRCGKGVEAWISMQESKLGLLDTQIERNLKNVKEFD